VHGVGRGMLSCVDVRTGAKIWDSRKVDRTLSDVAISDGLLYIADYSAKLHCFNAETGEHYWSFEMDQGQLDRAVACGMDGRGHLCGRRGRGEDARIFQKVTPGCGCAHVQLLFALYVRVIACPVE
jgi:outer membrane protein assembly factor BamB